jgi:hypothetical protein
MALSHDELRARAADGLAVPGFKGRLVALDKSPLTRTGYALSAAEFNATQPEVAHEAATARAIQKACGLSAATSNPHPREAYDRQVATAEQYSREVNEYFDAKALNPDQLVKAGLVRPTIDQTTNSQTGRVYTSRGFVPTAAGRRLLGRVRRYLAGGGQLPVQPVADILRKCAWLRPAVTMPVPHPFVISRYSRPDDVVAEASKLADRHALELMARLGFNARNSSTRSLDSMQRLLLRRDVRDAELLGLVRRCGDILITTDQGARQAREIPAPATKARAA